MRTARLRINQNEQMSLERPAWTQDDQHAYKHRHIGGKISVIKNYFIRTKGKDR